MFSIEVLVLFYETVCARLVLLRFCDFLTIATYKSLVFIHIEHVFDLTLPCSFMGPHSDTKWCYCLIKIAISDKAASN